MKKILLTLILLFAFHTDFRSQWIKVDDVNLGGDIMALLEHDGVLYAGGTAYLFRSSNQGAVWNAFFTMPAYAWSLSKLNNVLYCGLAYTSSPTPGVYKSTDNGSSWSLTSLSNSAIISMAAGENFLVAIAFNKIYLSSDGGQSWSIIKDPAFGNLFVSSNRIYLAGSGLSVTTDMGNSWNVINNSAGWSVTAKDSVIFFGTQDGIIYRSTNYGQSWENKFQRSGAYVHSLLLYNQYVFAGTDSGFYFSSDNGETFISKNDNLGKSRITASMVYNNYIYAGNGNYAQVPVSVWKRPLSELTSIDDKDVAKITSFVLYQNHPNPFNPITRIQYSIAGRQYVTLKVYDVLGTEVKTLVSEIKEAGSYSAEFNAENLPSGVYIYKLQAGNFTEAKKMTLIR